MDRRRRHYSAGRRDGHRQACLLAGTCVPHTSMLYLLCAMLLSIPVAKGVVFSRLAVLVVSCRVFCVLSPSHGTMVSFRLRVITSDLRTFQARQPRPREGARHLFFYSDSGHPPCKGICIFRIQKLQ